MGYSEIYCKLCGISFNIGRVRQPDEPYHAAWSGGANRLLGDDGYYQSFVSKDYRKCERCPASAGCQDVVRPLPAVDEAPRADDEIDNDDVDVDDDDTSDDIYIPESEEEVEPFEYQSDEDLLGNEEEVSDEKAESSGMSDIDSEDESMKTYIKAFWEKKPKRSLDVGDQATRPEDGPEAENEHRQPKTKGSIEASPQDNNADIHNIMENVNESWSECDKIEHLAGPGCKHRVGYSGFEITAEEMKGCTVAQCLVRKSPNWQPEPDDLDFELSSDYFLSGLIGHMPSRDSCWGPNFTPLRHGCEDLFPDTGFGHDDTEFDTPMPFHPTCFEVFTRASRFHLGQIDIAGLAGWRLLESRWKRSDEPPRDPAVCRGMSQDWRHRSGDAWIAANPVLVPSLPSFLQSSWSPRSASYAQVRPSPDDPFLKLPRELSDAILDLLSPLDRASLRLASCATYLPLSLWKRLFKEDMPWLWELWDDVEPYFWATMSLPALFAQKNRRDEIEQHISEEVNIVKEENPEIWEAWSYDQPWPEKSYATLQSSAKESPITLPAANPNWCRVYYEIMTHTDELPGLRNRRRIWTDVEEILRRIQKYRDEGKISN